MTKKWLGAGHYEITKGLFKRLWKPKSSLSVVIIPSIVIVKEADSGFIMTESGQPITTESGFNLLEDQ
jgi:hypothetical protein